MGRAQRLAGWNCELHVITAIEETVNFQASRRFYFYSENM